MREILHYLGYDEDPGGIVSVIRAQVSAGESQAILGMNHGARQARQPPLPMLTFIPLTGEELNPTSFWRARQVAREVQAWLAADPARVFHGHSRAGLVVGSWLHQWGERRVVVSVHCYGRRRWFYRQAAEKLGRRLFWLSPAMKRYYGAPEPESWSQCQPGGVEPGGGEPTRVAEPGAFRLIGIGERVRWKRWDLVLAALSHLPASVRFEHIGGGDRECGQELTRQTDQLGLSGRVRWAGREPNSRRLLAAADALVVASENEPLSMAMLEALAAGVPVIAADSGGAVDVVEPGRNGESFRSGDPLDLAAAVERWRMRPEGPSIAVPDASWRFWAQRIARQWSEIYASLETE